VFKQTVTYTAAVSVVAPGGGTPSGSVTFFDGAAQIPCANGSVTFDGSTATCTFRYTTLKGSPHQITATYSGDSDYLPSNSAVLSQTVNPSPTTTELSSSSNPGTSGAGVTFTVDVDASGGGGGEPGGTVTITQTPDGSTIPVVLCADLSLSNGGATCSTNSLDNTGSPYTIAATFTDTDGNYFGSSGTLTQTMN
jgi:hypothetical protein